jgi:hypothetical protein
LQDGLETRPTSVQFVHESTDDEKFTGRVDVLKRLDDWAADAGVRLVGGARSLLWSVTPA